MRIAYETSVINSAIGNFGDKSGVYRYSYNTLRYLSQIKPLNRLFLYDIANQGVQNLSTDLYPLFIQPHIHYPKLPTANHPYLKKTVLGRTPVVRWFAKKIDRHLLVPVYQRLGYSLFLKKISSLLEKQSVDILHVSETSFFKPKNIPVVGTVCDIIPILMPHLQKPQTVDLHNRKLFFLKKYATRIIAISRHTKSDLVKHLAFDPEKIDVIYLAPDPVFRPKSPDKIKKDIEKTNRLRFPNRKGLKYKNYLVYWGTFEPRKNIGLILRAFKNLKCSGRYKGDLLLVGGSGWGNTEKKIEDFVKENMLDDSVYKTSFIEDETLVSLVNGAQITLYPSLYEGFGLPVLESMSCGTPVITSDTSSLPEICSRITPTINPYDLKGMEQKIIQIISSPSLRKKLSKDGLRHSAKFTWQKVARQTLATYRKAIKV